MNGILPPPSSDLLKRRMDHAFQRSFLKRRRCRAHERHAHYGFETDPFIGPRVNAREAITLFSGSWVPNPAPLSATDTAAPPPKSQ